MGFCCRHHELATCAAIGSEHIYMRHFVSEQRPLYHDAEQLQAALESHSFDALLAAVGVASSRDLPSIERSIQQC